jgi:hypothetical protein
LVQRGISHLRTNIAANFYHLRIANQPNGIRDKNVAESVAGTVTICDQAGNYLVPARVHRWAASPQVGEVGIDQKADRYLALDIEPYG